MLLLKLHNRLVEYKTHINPKLSDPDDSYDDRHNYCHMVYLDPVTNKMHTFQVRGFSYDSVKEILSISAVNWTICAGTCTIRLMNEHLELAKWKILEDEPTLQILFDR